MSHECENAWGLYRPGRSEFGKDIRVKWTTTSSSQGPRVPTSGRDRAAIVGLAVLTLALCGLSPPSQWFLQWVAIDQTNVSEWLGWIGVVGVTLAIAQLASSEKAIQFAMRENGRLVRRIVRTDAVVELTKSLSLTAAISALISQGKYYEAFVSARTLGDIFGSLSAGFATTYPDVHAEITAQNAEVKKLRTLLTRWMNMAPPNGVIPMIRVIDRVHENTNVICENLKVIAMESNNE